MSSPTRDWRDCSVVVRELWEYLDGRASTADAAEIRAHLEWCEGCRAHFAFEAQLVQTIGRLRRQHSDPVRLRTEVLDVLKAAGFSRSDQSPA